MQGPVTIERAGRTIAATHGADVQVGDRLHTGPGGQVTVTLADGTQLQLQESSELVLLENQLNPNGQRAATKLDLLKGLVRSVVRFAPGNAPNYEVHTPNAVAAARGTDYDTSYTSGVARREYRGCLKFTDVAVREGEVDVSNPSDPTAGAVQVKKGHRTTVPCGYLPVPPSPAAIAAGVALGGMAAGGAAATGIGVGGGFGGGSGSSAPQPPITSSR